MIIKILDISLSAKERKKERQWALTITANAVIIIKWSARIAIFIVSMQVIVLAQVMMVQAQIVMQMVQMMIVIVDVVVCSRCA